MLRAIRSVLGAAAILFGGALLAQPKESPQAEGYFPLKKGTKWTYKVGDNVVEVVVVKGEKPGDEYQVDTFVGKEPAKTTEWYVVKADGVYRTKVKDDKLDPYVKVLALPVKKDTTWDINSKCSISLLLRNTGSHSLYLPRFSIIIASSDNAINCISRNGPLSPSRTTPRHRRVCRSKA